MSWDEFCDKNKMGKRFHSASFDSSILDKSLLSKAMHWLENPTSLILHGKAGRGKTYYSICLLKGMFELYGWASLRWFKSKQFDDLLLSSVLTFGTAKDAIESISDVPFLFLDDFGTETAGEHIQRDWFQLIDFRWSDEMPTILTTNLTQEEIRIQYGERIYSRFQDYNWIEFKGDDLRGRK